MVFIHETHVMPSSGKVKAKRHLLSYFFLAGSECCLNYVHLDGTGCTHLLALY